jgi:hypothetical protein
LIGINGLKAFARNATDVVLEVNAIVLTALLQAYDILILVSNYLMYPLYRQASIKTKMSSAAIPKTINIARECRFE